MSGDDHGTNPSAIGREVLHNLLICCGPIPEGGTPGCRGCDAARADAP